MTDPLDRLKNSLADRYVVEQELGHGGMATVYLAHDLKHDRKVAVKVLRPELVAVIGTERFLQEIRVTANLQHPNIVQLYDSGEADGVLYYVMPAIEGESLRDKLDRENQLSIEEAVEITRAVAGALDYAHRRNVVHRDIKPENIMLQEGTPLVADFGIALAVTKVAGERLTDTGMSLGTPSYMSPEQATGDRELTARTDVYALGCVLYEMLAGDPPFTGSNIQAVIAKLLVEKPLGLRAIRDTIPANIEAVVDKALAKVPADRFKSAKDFAEALTSTGTHVTWTPETPMPFQTGQTTAASRIRSLAQWRNIVPAGAVALLVWALLARGGDSSAADTAGSSIRPITRFSGWEMGPSWSPDGTMIVYSQMVGGSAEIATLSLGGGDPHVLTDDPTDEVNPRWSPDGAKIAFVSDRGAGSSVYWLPPTGGAERKLVETHIPFLERMQDWYGALGANPWSPDAQELVFSKLHETGEVALWKVNLSTREQTQLTFPPAGGSDTFGSWSFDGQSIAFQRSEEGGTGLWRVKAEGGEASLLLGDEHFNGMPAWSPDNGRLAFVSSRSRSQNLWEIDLDTRELRQLTVGIGNDAQPVFTQNGMLAYSNWNHEIDVYLGRLDGPNQEHERLTSFTGSNFGARVSPDGSSVLYFSNRATGLFDLWLLDRATGLHQQLTDDPTNDKLADWSPDGKEVVFMSDRGGAIRLWVIDTESRVVRQLVDHVFPWSLHPAEAGGPRWSPDGSVIGYIAPTAGGNTIWLVGADGSDPHPSIVQSALSLSWYRDGQRVLYTRSATDGSGVVELRAAHLGTGEDVLLLAGSMAEVEVSPDGKVLSFVEAVSHFTMNLHLLRLALPATPNGLPRVVGEAQQVTFGGGIWHVHNGGWAPDGQSFVYSRDRDYGDIYVIESNK